MKNYLNKNQSLYNYKTNKKYGIYLFYNKNVKQLGKISTRSREEYTFSTRLKWILMARLTQDCSQPNIMVII